MGLIVAVLLRRRPFLGLGLAIVVALAAASPRAAATTVTIDGSQTYQTIDGFGVNANHRSWNNDELKPVLDALIDQAGMTLFRVIFDKADWEATNDNDDPNVMNWDYYNQVYSAPDFQKMWDMSAYLNGRGITDGLIFNFQGNAPDWMGGSPLTMGYEAEWAEMVASLFIYARNTQHVQFSVVAPDNEPDISVQGVDMTSDQYVTALHTLSDLLDTNGLSDLRFVGPDLGYTSTDWLSAMMGDPTIMAKLAHFGLHSYLDNGGGSTGIYAFLQESAYPDRTFWMTEFNYPCSSCESGVSGDGSWGYAEASASYLLYHLANGASAGLVWEGYDSQYNYYSPLQWSYWGLFGVDNINAVPKTYTPRKSFYAIAQISKFIRPGAQQLDVSPWMPPQLLAFYHQGSGQLTLAGVNTDTSPYTFCGVLTNLPAVASLDLYYTDSNTDLCHSVSFPVTNGAFAITVPADCVFTLVGFDPARLIVSVAITNPPDGAFYTSPATIPIQATATTTTGAISQVEFFCGTTNLGEALAAPYSITWSNVLPGTYELSCSATDSLGNFGVSSGIRITVAGPAAQIAVLPMSAVVMPYGSQGFNATVLDALGTVLIPQPSLSWSASGGGTIDSNGLFTAADGVGGPFAITASVGSLVGTASVSVASNVNLALAGLGYTWYSLTSSGDDSPNVQAPGINDGDLGTDVPLLPGGPEDTANAYEAAGVVWGTPRTFNRIVYNNGSYTADEDGVFAAGFGLQFSPDGQTWTNAGSAWVVSPAYVYNSPASANTSFTFTGATATVRGVRCVGRVHTRKASSWVANATELRAFAAPLQPVGPQVSIQPTNLTALDGTSVRFSVVASGSPFLRYQWLFNGASLYSATANTLCLTNVQAEQAGSYSVVVTNTGGSATSAVATLTVLMPPIITQQPTNKAAVVGATVMFSIAALGTEPLSYQWRFNCTNLDGALAGMLCLTNVQPGQAGGYSVVVTNVAGFTTSAVATLTVLVPPIITLQPTNQMALPGATVNFSVAAEGTAPLSCQWRFNGTNIDGAVAETLWLTNVQPEEAGAYAAQISNAAGTTNSAVALLSMRHYPLLLNPRTTAEGAFAFTLQGDAGSSYVVEVGTNFLDWAPLRTLSNVLQQTDFTDSTSSNSTPRFYRARLAN